MGMTFFLFTFCIIFLGELNEEIGFFPANRIRLETSQGPQSEPLTTEEPPTMPTSHQPMQPQAVETPIPSPPKVIYDSPLPQGWEHAYDEEGTIYYFNEFTGESRWERPADELEEEKEEEGEEDEEEEEERRGEIKRDESLESYAQSLQPDELKKLEFHQLKPDWIRHKGYVQMKMISEKEDGGKLSSWKVYYAVLSNGFLLLYKEAHAKSKKPSHTHVPVGSFDLESCKIDPAGKQDTKRKHVFIISTPKKVKLYIQTTSDKEFSAWLDAIMRELVKRKEGQNEDTEILRLLKSLTFDESQMKVNRKMTSTDDKKSKGHWFSSKPGKNGDIRKIEPRYVYGQTQPSGENDVFGGLLRMEENGDIPHIVTLCIKEVEARGLKSVGIYRLSGPASTIQKYRAAFNNKEAVSFKDEQDINTVTGLLKLYFRELRNPLMTHEYYDWFMEAARMNDYEERMYQIKSIIHSLPKPNYTVLEYLMRHLNLVASYSEINKMESSNLALIFSVGLLRSPLEDLSSIMQSDLQSKIIEAIIQQVDWFFEEEEENVEDV
ncbi:Rho GTPase activation protein [Mucor mucedo]|uniref:Rho GTPase activation protein n=1 Tax=Mucor mucedo TaxID=29922 RepID=UPI00221F06B4|nr:Rho GTPase activation protein [Mucor mucedo]KAI7888660.1 Rho GTPase activation protein [Mucor mucedo]